MTLVDVPDVDLHPFLLKSFIHELQPTGVVFWIDSDIVITRSLDDLAGLAASGKICLFQDWVAHRWIEGWQSAFDLRAPVRRQPYLNAGVIAFSHAHWPGLLARWAEICKRIPLAAIHDLEANNPFHAGDQDAINALLMSEIPQEAVMALPLERSPTTGLLHQVRIVEQESLSCCFRGERTSALHYVGALKPWQARAWRNTKRDAYVLLLIRALFGLDAPVRLRPDSVPLWLRPDRRGRLLLRALSAVHHPRARVVDAARPLLRRLPPRVREPLLTARSRRFQGRRR